MFYQLRWQVCKIHTRRQISLLDCRTLAKKTGGQTGLSGRGRICGEVACGRSCASLARGILRIYTKYMARLSGLLQRIGQERLSISRQVQRASIDPSDPSVAIAVIAFTIILVSAFRVAVTVTATFLAFGIIIITTRFRIGVFFTTRLMAGPLSIRLRF